MNKRRLIELFGVGVISCGLAGCVQQPLKPQQPPPRNPASIPNIIVGKSSFSDVGMLLGDPNGTRQIPNGTVWGYYNFVSGPNGIPDGVLSVFFDTRGIVSACDSNVLSSLNPPSSITCTKPPPPPPPPPKPKPKPRPAPLDLDAPIKGQKPAAPPPPPTDLDVAPSPTQATPPPPPPTDLDAPAKK